MPHYRYEALTDAGARITGTIEADSEDQAKTRVAAQGNFPTSVRQDSSAEPGGQSRSRSLFAAKVKPEDLILFTKQMRTMLDAGISVMGILSEVIGNAAIAREFDNLQDKLREGRGISGPLGTSDKFTPMIVSMIAVGEESGNLDEMLTVVSAHYDYEVDYAVGRMSEMITPLLTLLLAGVVGFFALAIFMPMWDLTKMAR